MRTAAQAEDEDSGARRKLHLVRIQFVLVHRIGVLDNFHHVISKLL